MKLNKNEYIHWQPADWTTSHGMHRFFSMDQNGVLTVKDHGLFLIYAQVSIAQSHSTFSLMSIFRYFIPMITTSMVSL